MSLKGCFSFIITRIIGAFIMTLICTWVASFTTTGSSYSQSIVGSILFLPLLLFFLIASLPVEALLRAQIEQPQNARGHQISIFFILLLPFGLMLLSPILFFTALAVSILLMVYSYFMSESL
jgi:hypothetical protein